MPKERNAANNQGKVRKPMAKESVARKKTLKDLAEELAADEHVLESVAVSMKDLAANRTVSFEDAFVAPRPR